MAGLTSIHSSAPAKFILFGEHAVVYGEPALAAPLTSMRAHATISATYPKDLSGLLITADDICLRCQYGELTPTHPIAATIRKVMQVTGISREPRAHLSLKSAIPVGAGLGSSAATSTAITHALSRFLQHKLSANEVSDLVFEVEKLQHGTPSGIDNTVIAHEQTIFFTKTKKPEFIKLVRPLTFLLADSGERSSTRETIAGVRERYTKQRKKYQTWFDDMGTITRAARTAVSHGDSELLGTLMLRNQEILQAIGVSSPSLDRLVKAALHAGVSGAKLSGSGAGGHIIAPVHQGQADHVISRLRAAGARNIFLTELHANTHDS